MLFLGIFLLVYGVACIVIGVFKFEPIWKLGKVQGFVKLLGETGTTIFFSIWGLIAIGFGIWITFFIA